MVPKLSFFSNFGIYLLPYIICPSCYISALQQTLVFPVANIWPTCQVSLNIMRYPLGSSPTLEHINKMSEIASCESLTFLGANGLQSGFLFDSLFIQAFQREWYHRKRFLCPTITRFCQYLSPAKVSNWRNVNPASARDRLYHIDIFNSIMALPM